MNNDRKIVCIRYMGDDILICYNDRDIDLCKDFELNNFIHNSETIDIIMNSIKKIGYFIPETLYTYVPIEAENYDGGVEKFIVFNETHKTYDVILYRFGNDISFPNYSKEYIKAHYLLDWTNENLNYIENL